MDSAAVTGLAISLSFLGAGGFYACSDKTTKKFNVGDCIRDADMADAPDHLGYFHLIVDKTETLYVWCQGQAVVNTESIFYERWYGCGPKTSVGYVNEAYVKVACPAWTVDQKDSPYHGFKSK